MILVRDNSASNGHSILFNRLTSTKSLSSFSGDPLDWFRFKQEFEQSTIRGEYTDNENVKRLNDCLRGDAIKAVRTLFAGRNTAQDIMESLEIRFGSPHIISSQIISEIRELPRRPSKNYFCRLRDKLEKWSTNYSRC